MENFVFYAVKEEVKLQVDTLFFFFWSSLLLLNFWSLISSKDKICP